MKFANFNFLYLLLSFLGLLFIIFYYYKIDKKRKYSLKQLIRPKLYFTTKYRLWFFIFGFAFLLISYFRPQWGIEKIETSTPNTALHIVIDVSKSMLVEDIKPSRLDFAKMTLKKLLKNMGTTNVSLIAFSNKAITVAPPTVDYELLTYYIDLISPSFFSGGGTAMNEGLKEVFSLSKNFSKNAVLLISDGESKRDLSDIIKKLNDKNIKVHSLLIGTAKGGPVPELDANGEIVSYKEQNGQTVISKATDSTLKKLSEKTGGVFSRPSYLSLNRVMKDLYDATKLNFSKEIKKKERYQYSLILAFLFFLGALIG